MTVLNNGIVVQPEDAKVGARLCTIVNVDVVDREEEVELLVAVEGELHAEHVEEVRDSSVETAVWPALVKGLA